MLFIIKVIHYIVLWCIFKIYFRNESSCGIAIKDVTSDLRNRGTSTSISIITERSHKEMEIDRDYYTFQPKPAITKESLLHNNVIEVLCSFCENLLWVSLTLNNTCKTSGTNEATGSVGLRRGSDAGIEQSQAIIQLIQAIRTYSESLKQSAEKCLYYLRLEIKAHTIYYLSKIKDVDYSNNDLIMGGLPDKYIIDLHKDMLNFDDLIHQQLTDCKIDFILDGVVKFIPIMMIRAFMSIKPANIANSGIDRLIRNLLAIQQTISSISDFNQGKDEIELLRQYFHLLKLSQTELLAFIKNHKMLFKKEEYDVIWNLETPIRPKNLRREEDYKKIFKSK